MKKRFIIISIFTVLTAYANAADINDLNEQQTQQERQIIKEQRQAVVPQSVFIGAGQASSSTVTYDQIGDLPCFLIKTVSLKLPDPSLESKFKTLLDPIKYGDDPLVGRCIGQRGLQHTLQKVQNELIEHGYITSRVMVEPQDLTTGHLELSLVPGIIDNVWRSQNTDEHVNPHNAMTVKTGDVFSLRELEASLENFRLPNGRTTTIDILPAQSSASETQDAYGHSDLIINKTNYQKVNVDLTIDDAGSSSTGKYQGTIGIQVNEPLASNDVFNISYLHSIDPWNNTKLAASNHNLYIGYQYPYKKWLLDASYNDYRYDQTLAGLNYDPIYQGVSKNTKLKASRQVVRTDHSKLSGYGTISHRKSSNYIDDLEILVQQRKTSAYELGIDYEHQYANASKLQLNASYNKGTGAFDASPIPETYFSDVAVHPSIWNIDARYQMPIRVGNHALSYRSNLSAQYSPHTLSSQDRFAIGSRYTVRGFDGESMLSGEKGVTLQQELSWQAPFIPLANQLYLGVDQGWVDGPSTQYLSGRSLVGSVIGIRLFDQAFSIDGFVGKGLSAPKGIDKDTTAGFRASISY